MAVGGQAVDMTSGAPLQSGRNDKALKGRRPSRRGQPRQQAAGGREKGVPAPLQRQHDTLPCTLLAPPQPTLAQLHPTSLRKPALKDLKTIVINLERRPDRMKGCAEKPAAHCHGLSYECFPATDSRRTLIPASEVASSWNTARNVVYQKLRAVRKGWNDLDTYQERELELSPGERGWSSSHIRAWRRCLELAGSNSEPLLVLEDDASPTPEFVEILTRALSALPADADLLYLGYTQAADWRREVSAELVQAEYVWATVGCIIWPAGARNLLSRLPINMPVDNWMGCLCAEGHINAYCVRPKIILQAEAWNVNSDVANSDEHYWGPDSDIRHFLDLHRGPEEPQAKRATYEGEPPTMTNSLLWDVGLEDSDGDCASAEGF
jgi:GR25 family glycosyltransferase involved in LPS biosynthesis